MIKMSTLSLFYHLEFDFEGYVKKEGRLLFFMRSRLTVCGWLVGWLVGLFRYINFCRLFNTKSIFMKIVLFQAIQFSISTQLKCKYSSIVKNISISSYSVLSNSSNSANSVLV